MAGSSPPPTLPVRSLAFPVLYRCLLLANSEGEICGVRLGPGKDEQHLVVSEVLSESVQGLCQVAEGDIVTHIDGVSVLGAARRRQRQGRQERSKDGRRGGGGGREVNVHTTLAEALQRRQVAHTRQRMGEPSLQQHQQHQQHQQQQYHPYYYSHPSVIELRLIRASSLPKSSSATSSSSSSSSSPPSLLRHLPVFYYETHPRDTLESIAKIFQTSPQEIRRDNRDYFRAGEKAGGIHPGVLLKMRNPMFFEEEEEEEEEEEGREKEEEKEWSGSSSLLMSSSSSSSSPFFSRRHNNSGGISPTRQRAPSSSSSSSSSLPRTPPSTPPSLPRSLPPLPLRLLHDVLENESVEDLARRLNVQIMDLRKWNRSLFPTGEVVKFLPAGTKVVIFAAPSSASASVVGMGSVSRREGGREGGGRTRPIRIVEEGREGGRKERKAGSPQ